MPIWTPELIKSEPWELGDQALMLYKVLKALSKLTLPGGSF